jgi:hypothetical protein
MYTVPLPPADIAIIVSIGVFVIRVPMLFPDVALQSVLLTKKLFAPYTQLPASMNMLVGTEPESVTTKGVLVGAYPPDCSVGKTIDETVRVGTQVPIVVVVEVDVVDVVVVEAAVVVVEVVVVEVVVDVDIAVYVSVFDTVFVDVAESVMKRFAVNVPASHKEFCVKENMFVVRGLERSELVTRPWEL